MLINVFIFLSLMVHFYCGSYHYYSYNNDSFKLNVFK